MVSGAWGDGKRRDLRTRQSQGGRLNTHKATRHTRSHVELSFIGPLMANNRIIVDTHTNHFLSNLNVVFRIFSECSENGTVYLPTDAISPTL